MNYQKELTNKEKRVILLDKSKEIPGLTGIRGSLKQYPGTGEKIMTDDTFDCLAEKLRLIYSGLDEAETLASLTQEEREIIALTFHLMTQNK